MIFTFLQGEQVAQALKHGGWTQTLHALEDDDEVSQAGTQLGVFHDLKEALAADCEEKIVVAYFAVILKGEQACFGISPMTLIPGNS